jgi:hypothetical protein
MAYVQNAFNTWTTRLVLNLGEIYRQGNLAPRDIFAVRDTSTV